ncbi:neprilysin-21-like [Amblyomma americanum]
MAHYSWMDAETQARVNGRLRRLRIVLGPLATLSKPADVRRRYRHLQPFGDSTSFTTWLLEQRARNVRARNAELMNNGAAFKASPEPEAFLDVQPTAVLDTVRHELLTSPALLFPPFSTGDEAPHSDAVNYAALGSIVGSLLARHLDPVTGVYDLRGVRYGHTWYAEKSEATYLEQLHCVGLKQASYERINVTDKDASEVLAHTVGLRMAYAAFRKSAHNHSSSGVGGGSGKEAAPLGIGASGKVYDQERLFFAAYCFQLCGIGIPRHVTRSLPLNARCNLPLRELPEFGNAYSCPNGSAMVPEQTCL